MDVQKLFDDLESNNSQVSEQAKKKLEEFINQTKDQSILQGVMEYYTRTNSVRIIDVLVKVQSPNDICMLDRIAEWMRGQNRAIALDLLGFIIRKHPSWLYKIAKHKLIKEIIKLLQTEKEIIQLMSALLCIITLLPIIPSLVPNFLAELLDGFGHLAAWSAQNAHSLPGSQIIYVQIGMHLLFHYLYGMYPNSFIRYLRKFATKDSAIFQSTIKPLLETVRMHPMLISSTFEDETSNTRWKEKEPYDIIEECAKLSLDYNQDSAENFCKRSIISRGSATVDAEIANLHMRNWHRHSAIYTGLSSPFHSLVDGSNLLEVQRMTNPIWSPSVEILSTPPPTAAVMHTPTPNYNVPNMSAAGSLQGATGASPPEAAVEATPETTPLRDAGLDRVLVANSPARRQLLASSQPTSPMRKGDSPFRFDVGANTTNIPTATPHRLIKILNDRNQSLTRSVSVDPTMATSSVTVSPSHYEIQTVDSPTHISSSTREDQEVLELTNTNFAANHSDTLQDISADCGDETEQSPCSMGGLSTAICQPIARHEGAASRNRPKICCVNDTSNYLSYGTSPADCEHAGSCKFAKVTYRVRRSRSWPILKKSEELCGLAVCMNPIRHTQCGLQANGESSSPSGDDAVSAATHFKQVQQKSKQAKKFEGRLLACQRHSSTQTVPHWHYEEKIFELFVEQNNMRQKVQKKPFDPYEMFDQSVNRNVMDMKSRDDVLKDQIGLLHLMLKFERYRREVHAERNRRLLGKSRNVRSLQKDDERLRDQLKKQQDEMDKLSIQLEKYRKRFNRREDELLSEVNLWKTKYHTELETSKQLRSNSETLQRRLSDEKNGRKEMTLQIEALRGELFDMRNEMQQVQYQAELGLQYKQELIKLQSELMVVGELQVKCRDKLFDLDNLKARDAEALQLQDSYSKEVKELRSSLEAKCAQFDTIIHQIASLQAMNAAKDVNFTDQKRLFKSAKEEYEEKLKALEQKYKIQKLIILQMEQRISELYRSQTANSMATTTPESERTDFISSMEHNSPLSMSLTSNDYQPSLSTSLRSVTEIRNLQELVNPQPPSTATDHNFGSIPVTSSSVISQHHQPIASSSQAFASTSSSAAIATRRGSSSIQTTSSHSTITVGASTSTTIFSETRLQNISSTSSSSSSAL